MRVTHWKMPKLARRSGRTSPPLPSLSPWPEGLAAAARPKPATIRAPNCPRTRTDHDRMSPHLLLRLVVLTTLTIRLVAVAAAAATTTCDLEPCVRVYSDGIELAPDELQLCKVLRRLAHCLEEREHSQNACRTNLGYRSWEYLQRAEWQRRSCQPRLERELSDASGASGGGGTTTVASDDKLPCGVGARSAAARSPAWLCASFGGAILAEPLAARSRRNVHSVAFTSELRHPHRSLCDGLRGAYPLLNTSQLLVQGTWTAAAADSSSATLSRVTVLVKAWGCCRRSLLYEATVSDDGRLAASFDDGTATTPDRVVELDVSSDGKVAQLAIRAIGARVTVVLGEGQLAVLIRVARHTFQTDGETRQLCASGCDVHEMAWKRDDRVCWSEEEGADCNALPSWVRTTCASVLATTKSHQDDDGKFKRDIVSLAQLLSDEAHEEGVEVDAPPEEGTEHEKPHRHHHHARDQHTVVQLPPVCKIASQHDSSATSMSAPPLLLLTTTIFSFVILHHLR